MDSLEHVGCVIDTDVVIDFLEGAPYTSSLFRQLLRVGDLAISAVTAIEVTAAARPGTEMLTRRLLEGLTTVDVTAEIAMRAGELLGSAREHGEDFHVEDAIIASTAATLNVPLVTPYADRYRATGVHIVSGGEAVSR